MNYLAKKIGLVILITFSISWNLHSQNSFNLRINSDKDDGSIISYQLENGDFLISAYSDYYPLLLTISNDGSKVDTIELVDFPIYFKFTNIFKLNHRTILSGVLFDSLVFIHLDTIINIKNSYKCKIVDSIYAYFDYIYINENRIYYSGYFHQISGNIKSIVSEIDSNFQFVNRNLNLINDFNKNSIMNGIINYVEPSNMFYNKNDSLLYLTCTTTPYTNEGYIIRLNDTLGVDSIFVIQNILYRHPLEFRVVDSLFLISGSHRNSSTNFRTSRYILIDQDFNLVLDKNIASYNKNNYPSAFKNLNILPNNHVLFGYSDNIDYSPNIYFASQQSSFSLIKMDLLGNIIFQKEVFDSLNYLLLYGINLTKDGGYLLNGSSYNYFEGNFEKDIFISKLDSNGQISWIQSVIKNRNIVTLYPNPTADQLNISLSGENEIIESIQIYDLQGRIVLTQKAKSHSINLNISHLPSGVYLLRGLTQSGKSMSGKFVKE